MLSTEMLDQKLPLSRPAESPGPCFCGAVAQYVIAGPAYRYCVEHAMVVLRQYRAWFATGGHSQFA